LIAVVMLALTVARLATWALFRILLPTLLGLLSLFFGRPLRRAAYRCHEVGVSGDRGLQHAIQIVRARMLGHEIEVEGEAVESDPPEVGRSARSRVAEPSPPIAPEADELADFDGRLAEHERREPR
jgi:hypothetical protein